MSQPGTLLGLSEGDSKDPYWRIPRTDIRTPGVTSLPSGDTALVLPDRLCRPPPVPLSGWQPLCTSPLAVDHGGVPAVVEAAAVFPQTPLLLLLSFMPQLIHSLALACCCGWVPSLVTHTHSVWQFISGWVCVCMGERKQRRALLLERHVFFSF